MNRTFLLTTSAVGTVVGGTICYKEFLQGCHYNHTDDLRGKTAVITGANTGIGKETAKAFAKRGAKVIMACRDMNRCRVARREIILAARSSLAKMDEGEGKRRARIYCEELDLADLESVRRFADKMSKEENITYLINNAASMRDPKRLLTKDGFEKQMGVNHFGHFLLTNLLLAKLKESSPSRIVIVSSSAHYRGDDIDFSNLNWDRDYSPGAAYNASKLANVLFARQLAKRLVNTGVVVTAVHPGIVNTEIFRHMPVMQSISGYIFRPIMWLFLKTPRAGAQTTLYAALSPDVEGMSGAYFSNCSETEPADKVLDEETAARLWAVSEKWTRLK